jgi:hypothetical protein
MQSTSWIHSAGVLALAALAMTPTPARGDILITEVIPNVNTTAQRGDIVELYNTGPGAVDLTDWVLTDLDNDPVGGVPADATFAPGSLGLATLGVGEFAVIDFVDSAGTAAWIATNYGLRITAPLVAGSYLGSERDELMLLDDTDTPIDFVAWADTGTAVSSDSWEDLSAVTGAVFDYGLTPGAAAWDGAETIGSDADYYASAVDFTAYAPVSTWGGGALRRRSTNGVFDVGAPDGAAQWEAVPRHQATLGNPSDDVVTGSGLAPILVTDDLATWLGQIENSTFPDRRLAPLSDQMTPDFQTATAGERSDWQDVVALAMSGAWEETFAAADLLGLEVVEFLDTATGETFHILRERVVPGEPGFAGRGTYVFFEGAGVRERLVVEIPHPVFDSETLEEGARALVVARPRVALFAGTHRNNHLTETTCDGNFDGGAKYRISDVAHHPDNFFHATHLWLHDNLADMLTVQLHGFCCPGVGSYAALVDDCVASNGIDAVPAANDFTQILEGRIEAQNFLADGVDLTTVAVFGEDADVLGATNNLQGRISNGVAEGDECLNAAVTASGRFYHLEQDPDVREEYEHILVALAEAYDELTTLVSPCDVVPAMGCRSAAKAKIKITDLPGTDSDRLQWKWGAGQATELADYSDAVAGSAVYQVCVWDASASAQPLVDAGVGAGGTCDGKPCWKARSTKGYGYKSTTGAPAGITSLKLQTGVEGKAKLGVKAAGTSLALSPLPLVTPVTVQLLVDDGMGLQCWESTFTGDPKKNDGGKFQAKQ